MERRLDCGSCGRTGMSLQNSIDLCNRVHCPVFDKLNAKPSKLVRFWIKLKEAFAELGK